MAKTLYMGLFLMMVLASVYVYLANINVRSPRLQKSERTITPLKDNKTFIIGSYYDDRRGPYIRTIAIVYLQDITQFYCLLYCKSSQNWVTVKGHVEVHEDSFGFPYGATDIMCPEPNSCIPSHVSFFKSNHQEDDDLPEFPIQNRNPGPTTSNFTVCISTMFGHFNNALQFIQSIEMYKILGAQRVTIYKNSVSPLMEELLQYYITQGTVTVVEWPIDDYLNVSDKWHHSMDAKDIGYYAQITALNDCVYRNMYTSKHVVLMDIDEIILPIKYKDWNTMIEDLEAQYPSGGVFLFDNHVFPRTVLDPTFEIKAWQSIPGYNILQHVYREPMPKYDFNNRKLIINPRKVVQTSVHTVLVGMADIIEIKPDVAILHHCREPLQVTLNQSVYIRDTTLWNYSTDLVNNVGKVIQGLSISEGGWKFSGLRENRYW